MCVTVCAFRYSVAAAACFTAVLRAESIAIAVAALVGEGAADTLVVVPAGQGLRLILAVAVVALVAAHITVNVVCKQGKRNILFN